MQLDRRAACSGQPTDSSFLEEGSPTMVEKGMDPSTVFEMCDDEDDNGIHDVKESGVGGGAGAAEGAAVASSPAASPPSGAEGGASLRHRRAGRSADRAEVKSKRESWMDPPGETESNTLTQAEMESCMQTYAVRASSSLTFQHSSSLVHFGVHLRVALITFCSTSHPPTPQTFSCITSCLISVKIKLSVKPKFEFNLKRINTLGQIKHDIYAG